MLILHLIQLVILQAYLQFSLAQGGHRTANCVSVVYLKYVFLVHSISIDLCGNAFLA